MQSRAENTTQKKSNNNNNNNKNTLTAEEFHYWQCIQVIDHISVNVTDSCSLLTGDQLTCNFVL